MSKEEIMMLQQALENHREGKHEQAKKNYEHLLTNGLSSPVILNNLACLYKQNKNSREGIKLLGRAIKEYPDNCDAYINLSTIFLEKNELEKALEVIDRGLELCIENDLIFSNKSIILLKLGHIDDAIINIQKAINLNKQNPKNYYFLGIIYKNKKEQEKSLVAFEKCISLNKEMDEAHEEIGLIHLEKKDPNKAINYLKKACQINNNKNSHLINLAVAFSKLKQTEEAENIYLEILKKNTNHIEAKLNLGGIYNSQGLYKKGIEITNEIITINPQNSIALYNLALMYKSIGQLDKAYKNICQALEIDNNLKNGILLKSSILHETGNIEEAFKIASNLDKKEPNNEDNLLNLAGIFQSKGLLVEAKSSLLNCLNINIENYRAHFLLSVQNGYSDSDHLINFILEKDPNEIITNIDKIDFLFTKSNILHHFSKYKSSGQCLIEANNLKSKIHLSNKKDIKHLTQELKQWTELNQKNIQQNKVKNIFITGMPRCGSTLIESILNTYHRCKPLGEINYIEKIYQRSKLLAFNNINHFEEEYINRINFNLNNDDITVDKQLYNYIYIGLIVNTFKSAKIIHCLRNPLDNIISIYRSHFASGNQYSTSIPECIDVYINHYNIISYYKNKYPDRIFTILYEELVNNPKTIIQGLTNWLEIEWSENFLNPHLFKRQTNTASRIQIRSPINNKSINKWKKYDKLFEPYMDKIKSHREIAKLL